MIEKPKLKLWSETGNAFFILAEARKAALKADWLRSEIDAFIKEATSGGYDHLIQTCMKYFDVS